MDFCYENPTETGLAIKGLTWGLQNGACADSLADAHADIPDNRISVWNSDIWKSVCKLTNSQSNTI